MENRVVKFPELGLPNVTVTPDGVIKTMEGKILTVYASGQVFVPRGKGMRGRSVNASKVVAEAWIPNPGNHPYVIMLDGDKSNLHPDNLEWSPSYNKKQERMSEEMFGEILLLRFKGWNVTAISKHTGVSIFRVTKIVKEYDERRDGTYEEPE